MALQVTYWKPYTFSSTPLFKGGTCLSSSYFKNQNTTQHNKQTKNLSILCPSIGVTTFSPSQPGIFKELFTCKVSLYSLTSVTHCHSSTRIVLAILVPNLRGP